MSLSYPVLCLPATMGVCVALDSKDLQRCQAVVYWSGRFYVGLRLIDAGGNEHEVVEVEVRKPASAIGQWIARFLDLCIWTEIRTKEKGPASVADIVEAVDASIEEDPETFEEFSGHDVNWWKTMLSECTTVKEIMQRLRESG